MLVQLLPSLDIEQKPDTISDRVAVSCEFISPKLKADDNTFSESDQAAASASLRHPLGPNARLEQSQLTEGCESLTSRGQPYNSYGLRQKH